MNRKDNIDFLMNLWNDYMSKLGKFITKEDEEKAAQLKREFFESLGNDEEIRTITYNVSIGGFDGRVFSLQRLPQIEFPTGGG